MAISWLHYAGADPALLMQLADAADSALLIIHIGTSAVGRLLAQAGIEPLDGATVADSIEALGWLVAELNDMAGAVHRITEGIASLERLVCERFAEFEAAFGDTLPERFKSLGGGKQLATILSAAPSASPAAQAAFLALAERGEIPHTPTALRSLAAERPGSALLLLRCWDTLGNRDQNNNSTAVNAEVGFILREHFSGDANVRQKLMERFMQSPTAATAIPLAIFAPDADELPFPVEIESLGSKLADWAVAVQVAASRADSISFCKLLEAIVTRRRYSQFDAQRVINLAVAERLLWDVELEGLLSARIGKDFDPSISGSFARYLAAAGRLNPEARGNILCLLEVLVNEQRLPVGGFDAVADQWRAVRATLLDAVSSGLELS